MTADQQYPLYCQRGPYENPYENFVFSLTNRYPELRHLSSFLQHNTDTGLGRMTVLNFFSSGQVSDNKITHPKELQCLIRGCDTDGIVGHILLVEDLTRVSIEILGQRFGVDPRFFAHHLREPRKGLGGGSRMSSSLPRMLPSDARRAPHFMIEYEQSLNFGGSSQEFPKRLRCQSNVLRKVGLTKVASSNEFVGTARRCFSVLKVPREHVRWLFIILLDPPVGNTFFLDYGDSPTPIRYDSPKTRPLRGGYSDISAIPILSSISIKVPAGINSGPQRNSLMEDLVYFWKSQQLPFRFNINDPDMFSISYFGLRIASSEWLCFLSFIQDTIETFEKSLEGEHPEEDDHMRMENNLASLQKMKRRFNTFNSDINATIATFKSHLYLGAEAEFVSAMELDFREIAARLSTFQQRVEGTLPVVTALVQIHDGRRSYQETTNLTRLTYLALTFVPLSFCSSLFSMSEGIAPGGPRFWIYFAVAIPLLLLTFAIVFSHSFDFRQVWSRVSVSLKKVYS